MSHYYALGSGKEPYDCGYEAWLEDHHGDTDLLFNKQIFQPEFDTVTVVETCFMSNQQDMIINHPQKFFLTTVSTSIFGGKTVASYYSSTYSEAQKEHRDAITRITEMNMAFNEKQANANLNNPLFESWVMTPGIPKDDCWTYVTPPEKKVENRSLGKFIRDLFNVKSADEVRDEKLKEHLKLRSDISSDMILSGAYVCASKYHEKVMECKDLIKQKDLLIDLLEKQKAMVIDVPVIVVEKETMSTKVVSDDPKVGSW